MNDANLSEHMALLIPILAVLGAATIPAIYLFLRFLRRRRLFDLYHEERMAAIAKGIELPPLPDALLYEGGRAKPRSPGQALLKGLIWLFIGIGLFLAVRAEHRSEGLFALIPVGIGCAYLIYYFIEGRKAAPLVEEHSTPEGPMPLAAQS
jgi:hypothetical protein